MSLLFIDENKTIGLALIGSLLLHGLLFIFSGTAFIQHAQYSVQPSAQMVEVSIEEIKESSVTPQESTHSLVPLHEISQISHVPKKQSINVKAKAAHSNSGVTVKANPDYFQNPPPLYPELARQMHQEGLVILAVDVNSQGLAVKVEIQQSSGHVLLDQAALEAVRRWRFQPGRVGNVPVESKVTIPIKFRLEV